LGTVVQVGAVPVGFVGQPVKATINNDTTVILVILFFMFLTPFRFVALSGGDSWETSLLHFKLTPKVLPSVTSILNHLINQAGMSMFDKQNQLIGRNRLTGNYSIVI